MEPNRISHFKNKNIPEITVQSYFWENERQVYVANFTFRHSCFWAQWRAPSDWPTPCKPRTHLTAPKELDVSLRCFVTTLVYHSTKVAANQTHKWLPSHWMWTSVNPHGSQPLTQLLMMVSHHDIAHMASMDWLLLFLQWCGSVFLFPLRAHLSPLVLQYLTSWWYQRVRCCSFSSEWHKNNPRSTLMLPISARNTSTAKSSIDT